MVKLEISNSLPPDEIIRRIEKALRHGGETHTWDDVRQGLIDGEFQIFWNDGGVAITEIINHPRKRVLHCFVVAGEMDSVVALQGELVHFAREHYCDSLSAIGRFGWERIARKAGWRGWKKTHMVFNFDLEGNA